MRKILLSFFIILFVCCASQNNAINKSENKHYLWKISDDNSSVWLLGSIHFADSTFYPLPEVIQNAFDESEELVVEINISDDSIANEITSQSLKKGILSQDVRLTDIIKSETWRTIDSLCSVWNYSCTQFLKMRPWFVAMTLTYLAISRTGIDSDYGIDAVLIDSALVRG